MPGAIFEPFDVVVAPFPFTDKTVTRRRPALVLSSPTYNATHDHLILSMITAARRSDWTSDVVLADWRGAGLLAPCRVRLKLFTLPKDMIVRRVGSLTVADSRAVRQTLAANLATATTS